MPIATATATATAALLGCSLLAQTSAHRRVIALDDGTRLQITGSALDVYECQSSKRMPEPVPPVPPVTYMIDTTRPLRTFKQMETSHAHNNIDTINDPVELIELPSQEVHTGGEATSRPRPATSPAADLGTDLYSKVRRLFGRWK